ncbi:MAG: YrbL family protein, partial [Pelovirga sp.]
MQEKTLKLTESLFVARGRQRECYVHPDDPDLCIKVTVQTRSKWREQNPREFKYYKLLEQRGIDWNRIAPCSGWVKTDKGQGLVFGLIRDRNGQICKNLQFLIDNNILTNEEIEFELTCLRNWLLDNAIIVCDLKPANIVYNPDNDPGHRLVLVDGVNNRDFIKTADFVKSLARNKIKRVWKRFEHKHLQDKISISDFEWFFNPNVACDSAFFSFLKQHVDSSLKEDLSRRHQLEYHDYNDKGYVFKRFSPSDNSDISRKVELSIKSYIISGAQRSFRGATWLQEADIPSITPVAWAVIGKGYRQVSYFVYEK